MTAPTVPDEDLEPCPGPCNNQWVAAERTAHNEQLQAVTQHRPANPTLTAHGVPMVPAAPMWCRPCQERIITAIKALPGHCRSLGPGPLNTGRDVQVGPRATAINPPSPSPGWDTADEVIRWAVHLEDQLRAHLGHADRTREPWRNLGAAVHYVTTYATALLSSPDAVGVGFAALNLARRLEQVTGADRVTHRLPAPCMVCGRKGLQRADGAELVGCRFCGATWDWGHYQFLAKTYADGVNAG